MFRSILLVGLFHQSLCGQSSVRVTLDAIEDGVSQIGLPGKSRQIAINALMRNVKGAQSLTPTDLERLDNVTVLLGNIKATLPAEVAAKSGEVLAYNNALINCNTQNEANIDFSATATADTNHQSCRAGQYTDLTTQNTDCTALSNFLAGFGANPNCEFPAATQDLVTVWETDLIAVRDWFDTNAGLFDTKNTACQDAIDALAGSTTACNADQWTFEVALCDYREAYKNVCDGRDSCFSAAYDAATESALTADSLARQKVARFIDYVVCLVAELKADNADTAVATCAPILSRDLTADYSAYATTFVVGGWETQDICVYTAPVAQYPFATYYGSWDVSTYGNYPADLDWASITSCTF